MSKRTVLKTNIKIGPDQEVKILGKRGNVTKRSVMTLKKTIERGRILDLVLVLAKGNANDVDTLL